VRFGARSEREDTLAARAVPELAGARVRGAPAGSSPTAGANPTEVLATAGEEPWLVRHGKA